MTPRQAFEAWAPPHTPWSAWAKPTLFIDRTPARPGQMGGLTAVAQTTSPSAQAAGAVGAAPTFPSSEAHVWPLHIPKHCALVLDMPGPRAVEAGVSLRDRGYWPVPLFNATPGPNPVVDVTNTVRALLAAAPHLAAAGGQAGEQALPCFLIDDNRCPKVTGSVVGKYDNRSIVFPQDFPSATLLRSRGIEQVLVVHHTYQAGEPSNGAQGGKLADDLAHVLFAWQRDGLRILRFTPAMEKEPRAVTIAKPSRFGFALRRIMTFSGLRRSAAGGFGCFVPEQASGSGYS